MRGHDLGTVEPVRGRWVWPIAEMEINDYFFVAHEDREPEKVRNYVKMRAYQLGRSFSVARDGEDHPGYTKVTRVDPADAAVLREPAVVYGTVQSRIRECYNIDFEDIFRFAACFEIGQEMFHKAKQMKAPRAKRLVMWFEAYMDSEHDFGSVEALREQPKVQQAFGVRFEPDGIFIKRLKNETTLQEWQDEDPSDLMS